MDFDIWRHLKYSAEEPMFFTSGIFWIFLALVFLFYSFVYRRLKLRHAYLLVVSLYFYYQAGGWFFLILVFSTLIDFFLGLRIYKSNSRNTRKLLLAASILVNIGVLAYFKYAYFFAGILSGLFGQDLQVTNVFALMLNRTAGTAMDIHNIVLPVGVSFYTFQTISYTFDVFRGHVKPVRNIVDFGFYVSFFPQLVAGPIVRAAAFIPQLYQKYSLTEREAWHAVFLILGGLLKKMLVADYLAAVLIDKVFESPVSFTGFENLLSIYGYAVQIYFDFSGYTDIAIGVALLLGFRLPVNFNSPYRAVSLTDFWRRWHISLSSWLRDYLYIPMGGSRKGGIRTGIHLMVTMILGGLWHGANWRFVLWGFYHGALLVIEKVLAGGRINAGRSNQWRTLTGRILTFHLVVVGWLIFRAETPSTAVEMVDRVFMHFGGGVVFQVVASNAMFTILLLLSFVLIALPVRIGEGIRGWFIIRPYWMKIILVLVGLFAIYQFQTAELKPFIYFQF